MTRRSTLACAACALALSLVVPASPAAAAAGPVLTGARGFIVAHQQPDGGFEVAKSPSFETPDAVLALAEVAQNGTTWNATAARTAVAGVVKGGRSPLDYIDDQVETPDLGPGTAAKYLVLAVRPLGLNPRDVDPSGDSPTPVDLVATVGRGADLDGQFRTPAFNALLYIALAHWARDCQVPGDLVARITAAQQANGSWDFSGTPGGAGVDIDTTGLAVIALTRAGRPSTDPAIRKALTLLARSQRGDGGWQAFGATNPNSTALATLAIASAGKNPAAAAWRDLAAPELSPRAYVSPDTYFRGKQASDGHFVSPNDSLGLNTFGTSQAVQALTRRWLVSKPPSTTLCALPGGPRERFLRAAFRTLARRAGAVADLQPAAAALGADPTVAAKRLAAVNVTLGSDARRRAVVAELYLRVLGRPADPAGLAFWADRLRTRDRRTVEAELAGSGEFFRRAGGTNAAFLDRLYPLALGRAPDSAGRQYWLERLDGGMTRQAVAGALLASAEGRRTEVTRQYTVVLRRPADPAGVSYWAQRLQALGIEQLVASLVASPEYFRKATA